MLFRENSEARVFGWFLDEAKLVQQWRMLYEIQQCWTFRKISEAAFNRWIPDCDFMECVPQWDRRLPERYDCTEYESFCVRDEYIYQIVSRGIQETGEPIEVLLAPSPWRECIENFVWAVKDTQYKGGGWIWPEMGDKFAELFISVWQWEILHACERARQANKGMPSLLRMLAKLGMFRRQ